MAEKEITDVAQCWVDLYQKGRVSLDRHNYDYAIDIFNQVLEKEPAFFECRQALRVAQFKKANQSHGFFKKAFNKASSAPLIAKAQLALRSNPFETIKIAEQILNTDPNSSMAHKLLADAALAVDLPKTAALSLEILHKNDPDDREIAIKLANSLMNSNQTIRAEQIAQELVNKYPDDPELAQLLKNISAQKTLVEGGYEAFESEGASFTQVLKNKEEARLIEEEQRQVKEVDVAERLINDYLSRIQKEPQNLRLMRSLAELLVQKQRFDEAITYYKKILESDQKFDPTIEKAIVETTVKKFNAAISALNPNDPDYNTKLENLTKQRNDYQIQECKRQVERYPTDLSLRFELGQLYYNAGKLTEAIQEFQKAQANPHKRIQSLYYLGMCFFKRGMYDLAVRTFQNAIKEKLVFDDEKKELIYQLGCALEKLNKKEEAIEQFKMIYEVDIAFKDVAARVDSYYSRGNTTT